MPLSSNSLVAELLCDSTVRLQFGWRWRREHLQPVESTARLAEKQTKSTGTKVTARAAQLSKDFVVRHLGCGCGGKVRESDSHYEVTEVRTVSRLRHEELALKDIEVKCSPIIGNNMEMLCQHLCVKAVYTHILSAAACCLCHSYKMHGKCCRHLCLICVTWNRANQCKSRQASCVAEYAGGAQATPRYRCC